MKSKFKRISLFFGIIILSILLFPRCNSKSRIGNYKGTPYADSVYKKGAQIIPGKLQCEYFDFGGEGIAYHDNDSINSGSGHLNPSDMWVGRALENGQNTQLMLKQQEVTSSV